MATASIEPTTRTFRPDAGEPDPKRFRALAVIGIAQLMIVLDASVVTIALPSAQRALHISVANRQWALTAYTLAFGGLLLIGGRVADFMGRKRMFIISLLGFAAASALGGLAQNAAMLFGARRLTGCLCRRHGAGLAVSSDRHVHGAQGTSPGLRGVRGHRRRWGGHRPGARRPPDGVRLVALDPAHQRADRHPGRRGGYPGGAGEPGRRAKAATTSLEP